MSDIEKYYKGLSVLFGINTPWVNLHPMQQMQIIDGVNQILHVINQLNPTYSNGKQ
jgi:hypothetical protein